MAGHNPYALIPGTPIGGVGEAGVKKSGGNTALAKLKNSIDLKKVREAASDARAGLREEPKRDLMADAAGLALGYAGSKMVRDSKPESYLKTSPGKVAIGTGLVGMLGGYYLSNQGHKGLGKTVQAATLFTLGYLSNEVDRQAASPAPVKIGPDGKPIQGYSDPFDVLVSGVAAETGLPGEVCGPLCLDAIEGLDDPSVGAVLPAAALWALWQQAVKSGQAPAIPASAVVVQGLGYDIDGIDPVAVARVEGVKERMQRQEARKARRQARRAKRQGGGDANTLAAKDKQIQKLQQQIFELAQGAQSNAAAATDSGDDLELSE